LLTTLLTDATIFTLNSYFFFPADNDFFFDGFSNSFKSSAKIVFFSRGVKVENFKFWQVA